MPGHTQFSLGKKNQELTINISGDVTFCTILLIVLILISNCVSRRAKQYINQKNVMHVTKKIYCWKTYIASCFFGTMLVQKHRCMSESINQQFQKSRISMFSGSDRPRPRRNFTTINVTITTQKAAQTAGKAWKYILNALCQEFLRMMWKSTHDKCPIHCSSKYVYG